MSEAIVTDVSEEEELSPREQMAADIVSRTNEERAVETVGHLDVDEEETEETLEDYTEEMVTLQVNGEEVVVPKSQVEEAGIRTLQKETAADAKLEQASAREAKLLIREQELQALEEELQMRVKPDVEPDEVGKEFANALFEDEEVVAKTITSITQSIKALEDQNIKTVRETEAEKAAENERVIKYYHTTYKDISLDPDMHSSLNRRLSGVASENPEFTPREVVDEAAKQVYERFGTEEPKVNVKKNMPRHPNKASGRKPQVPDKKPKTRSEVLAEMQSGRGVQA